MPEIATPFAAIPTIPVCECVPGTPPEICIEFPVVGPICSGRNSASYESLSNQVLQFLGTLQPLLAPLMPILVLVSMVIAVVDCIKAIPKALSSLNPDPILDCIQKLLELLPQLVAFIPPLNYIELVRNVIFFMIVLVQALIDLLESILLLDVVLEVDNDQFQCCLDANVQAKLDQFAASLRVSGPLFKVVAELLKALSIPGTEKFIQPLIDAAEFLAGAQTSDISEDLVDTLRDLQKGLEAIHTVLGGVLDSVSVVLDCECSDV